MLIADCQRAAISSFNRAYKSVTNHCNRADRQWPKSRSDVAHDLLCAHLQLTTAASKNIRIAFDSEDIWEDNAHDLLAVHDQDAESVCTLRDLLLPKMRRDDEDADESEPDMEEFVEEDRKIVELLVASSLLNLNGSGWLRTDMNIESILLESSPSLSWRWKPLVACSLKAIGVRDEVHDAILSFGLLLMEMEGKKPARPKAVDTDWETGLPSKDSMLKRIIEEWNRSVGDGYRHIATACLLFRELSERLYDPGVTEEMGQIAAIYKYILAPLHKLITQQHSKISFMFTNFPSSLQSTLVTKSSPPGQAASSPGLVLFDGCDEHDPT